MSYAELLRDPRWQRKRLEVFERAGFRCEECGNGAIELQVHHRHYRSGAKPWEYKPGELRALCAPCHEKRTELDREIKAALGALDYADAIKVSRFLVQMLQPKPIPDAGPTIAKVDEMVSAIKKKAMSAKSHEEAIAALALLRSVEVKGDDRRLS